MITTRTLIPATAILPEYTDDALTRALAGGGVFGPAVAAVLLRVPAAYRQPIEAAAYQETTRTTLVQPSHNRGIPEVRAERVGNIHAVRERLVTELLAATSGPTYEEAPDA